MHLNKIKKHLFSIIKLNLFQELFFSGIGCLFFIFLFHFFPKKFHFESPLKENKYPKLILATIFLGFFFVFILFNQPGSRMAFFKTNYKRNIIIFSIFNFAIFYYLFYNTYFLVSGVYADNWYRSAYITQMANSGYPHDYCYKGLSAYYYPFFYYCLALVAKVFQIAPYKMLRYGFLFICYILPIILYESWKKIYAVKISFIITVLSIIILQDPYAYIHNFAFLLLIPFFFYYYENFTNKNFKIKDYMLAGILGAILLCTYLTYFLLIPIYYILKFFQNNREFKDSFKRISYISILIILFSSWYWIPFMMDFIILGSEVHQNKWFELFMINIPLFSEIYPLTIIGFILFFGLIFIVKNYRKSQDLKILGNLLLSLYILIFIGFIAILFRFPFYLFYRFFSVTIYILLISSSIFYVKFFHFLSHHDSLNKIMKKDKFLQIELFILIFFISAQNYYYINNLYNSEQYYQATTEYKPTKQIEIFEQLDYEDKVFLTHEYKVACFIPIYLFISPYLHFSHPSSYHNQRVKFLVKLSECDTSKEFYDKIMDCEFGPINFFYLELKENSTKFELSVLYGKEYDVKEVTITFDLALFEDQRYFKEIIIDDNIIYEVKD